MTVTPTVTALEPVAERLRRDAEAEAARLGSAARDEAGAMLARAHRDAAAAIEAAAAAARATAAPLTAAALRQARDTARSAVLSAQREAYDELLRQVHAGIAALADQPEYDQLRHRIERLAGLAAGPDALIAPDPGGGVVARSRGVLVDCSLGRLAVLAVAELGAAIRELWTP
jgi:vacuolar-type H+-ATPase subunit E/Vma4